MTLVAEDLWADRFTETLAERLELGETTSVTWLNHFSAQASKDAEIPLRSFDFVGIDGILLRKLIGADGLPRTSADLVMPRFLSRIRNASIAIVGGSEESSIAAEKALQPMLSGCSRITYRRSGYGELPTMAEIVADAGPIDLLIVGMGAPRQDLYVSAAAEHSKSPTIAITCGGWLDQVSAVAYYPSWAYKYRLNWLVRLCREPGRLWRRYTIDALKAWRRRKELSQWIVSTDGYIAHRDAALNDRDK